jgi:hypothetical protein
MKLSRWYNAWKAAAAALRGGVEHSVELNAKQLEALVELHANFILRSEELVERFPDIDFSIRRLMDSGDSWEWFPSAELHSIHADLTIHPANYTVVSDSNESDEEREQRGIQLIAPGIRNKYNKEAVVKAKIAFYTIKKDEDVKDLLDDLNDL